MSRTRTTSSLSLSGTATQTGTYPSTVSNSSGPLRVATCVDEVLPGDGYPLTITKRDVVGGLVFPNKSKWVGSPYNGYRTTEDFPPIHWSSSYMKTHLSISGRPSNGGLAAELLAKTNPSRAIVDLPVFFAELRELPRLVQFAGSNLLRRISSENLKYQFGVRPLVADLFRLLSFTDQVDKRMVELRALQAKGLRRKRDLWEGTSNVEVNSNVYTNSSPSWTLLRHRREKITSTKVWGFVRWFPDDDFPTTDRDQLRLARRAVLGLYLNGASLWELIPWSWLIDWFTSVGDFLNSRRNLVPCTHSVPQIMETKRTEIVFTKIEDKWGGFAPSTTFLVETKSRAIATASPFSAHIPVLSARSMSILASLVVLRSGKYL